MKDSGIPWIGQIPEYWEVCRVKDYSEIFSGEPLPNAFIADEPLYPVYGGGDILGYSKFSNVSKSNLILGRVGGDGQVRYIKQDFWATDNALIIDTKLNKSFVCNSLNCADLISLNTSTSQPLLTATKIKNVTIPLPSLREQEAIAVYLDKKCGEIDELIEVEQQMISDLESYRQSVITEAVTLGLNPDARMVESDCDWFASHPSHWRTEKIRNLFVKRTEKNNPIRTKERLSLSIDKGITLYADKTTNLDRFKDDFTQYQLAHPNDIVLNSMNMIVGAVGKSAYFGCVSPVYYVIYSKDANVNMDFYGYLLNTPIIRDVYHKLGQGIYAIERGDGRVNTCRLKVDYYEFSQIKVPVPPVEEQNTIVSFLKEKEYEIDELIKVKQEKIETLKQYRQSLIFEAVTGKTNID